MFISMTGFVWLENFDASDLIEIGQVAVRSASVRCDFGGFLSAGVVS
jgi:hypothetical protein